MIRNTLIAIYILAVLAISAVSRAESRIPGFIVEPKQRNGPIIRPPRSVDPLPGAGGKDRALKMLSIGNRGVNK
ncbi:hypothetical protein [Bdellovibrio sp. HCB337]|uniref:hypothetical protein n=1 Tax=Bdellovibrio sp. HCB337 TaxID=3394358 RepID=UPI0039A4D3B8